ncbi:MAG: FAD-binding protein [Chloroflexi bacterium]|nr:FAD-binding protein [Chloroflexota bacterium]
MVKVRDTRYDTGDGLKMALELGAGTTGQFSGSHACQAFLEGPDFEMGELAFAHGYLNGILVNVDGKRFIDEAEDFDLYTYAKLGRSVLAQPRNIGYQIFDAKVSEILSTGYNRRYRVAKPIAADTLEELAGKIDINEEAFLATVRQFNDAVQDGPYDPSILDGKCTKGIEPQKSNWALKIDTPPFLAYPVTCGLTFTFGGVKADTESRVIDTEGNPIPSLYAAGEVVGSFYFNYAGASGLIKGLVYGRIAGRNAAAEPGL